MDPTSDVREHADVPGGMVVAHDGSTGAQEALVHHSACPVVVVRPGTTVPGTIADPVDDDVEPLPLDL